MQISIRYDMASTKDAYSKIASGDLGDGPFSVASVHRRGIKLQPISRPVRHELVADEVFGGRGAKS